MMPRSTSPMLTSYLADSASMTLSLTRSNGNVSWNANTKLTSASTTSPTTRSDLRLRGPRWPRIEFSCISVALLGRAAAARRGLGLLGRLLGVGRDLERCVELVLALELAARDVEPRDRDVLGLGLDLLEELLELLDVDVVGGERHRGGGEAVAGDRVARRGGLEHEAGGGRRVGQVDRKSGV